MTRNTYESWLFYLDLSDTVENAWRFEVEVLAPANGPSLLDADPLEQLLASESLGEMLRRQTLSRSDVTLLTPAPPAGNVPPLPPAGTWGDEPSEREPIPTFYYPERRRGRGWMAIVAVVAFITIAGAGTVLTYATL